jgi:hypothetical protein
MNVILAATVILFLPFALARAQETGSSIVETPPGAMLTMQIAGRGRIEGPDAGSRFQGRFVIWSLEGREESVLGPDVSLFDGSCAAQFGRGAQCAHLVAVLNGFVLETFDTSSLDFLGHTALRTSATERLRIFFDPAPNGTRDFENLASFEVGEVVATYKVREFITVDVPLRLGISRNALELLESKPFTLGGVTVDLKNVAPRLTGVLHTRFPEPDPIPDPVPVDEPPFGFKGPGIFYLRFAVSGFLVAVESR